MKKDYDGIANAILEAIGGKHNIAHCAHCFTRLRIDLKDKGLVQLEVIQKLDVIGAQFKGDQLQVIIGNEINEIYDAFCECSQIAKEASIEERLDAEEKQPFHWKNIPGKVIDAITGCVVPLIPILIGSGLIKAIVLVIQQAGWLAAEDPTITTLTWVADAAFYFLPVFVGGFAAKKFNASISMGLMMGAVLIHPTFVSMVAEGSAGTIFGLSIYNTTYSSSILPAILVVWIMSILEHFLTKHTPKSIRVITTPLLTLLVMVPLGLVVIAPLGAMMSSGFASGLAWFYDTFGFLATGILAALAPFVVMTGMHIGTTPFTMESIATIGYDPIFAPAFFLSNFAQGAACFAVGIKTKHAETRALALSSSFSCIVPGVSEPGMYGIVLKYKKPMIAAMIGAGAGGMYCGLMGVGAYMFVPPNLFAISCYISGGMNNFIHVLIGIAIVVIVTFVVTLILYKDTRNEEKEETI